MSIDQTEVLKVIFKCINELNRQMPPPKRLDESPNTLLFGIGGSLDSLGIITLLVNIEDELENKGCARPELLSGDLFLDSNCAFHSAGGLAQWIIRELV